MLATLIESRRRSPKRRAALVGSAVAHSMLLSVLVMARARGDDAVTEVPLPPLVYIPAQPSVVEPRRQRAAGNPTTSSVSQLPSVGALPRIDALPSVGHVANPATGTRMVIHFDTNLGPPAPTEALSARTVDYPVELIPGQRPPRYPPTLERAGIEGDVTAQFIVDTLGRVEPGSVDVRDATHPDFARAVRERLVGLRFVPARARGRVVRQLVEQRFHFEVVRR